MLRRKGARGCQRERLVWEHSLTRTRRGEDRKASWLEAAPPRVGLTAVTHIVRLLGPSTNSWIQCLCVCVGGLCERPSMPSRVIAVVCMGPGCRARLDGKLYKQQAAPSLVYSHRATKVSKRQEDGRQRVSDARGQYSDSSFSRRKPLPWPWALEEPLLPPGWILYPKSDIYCL